MNVKSTGLKYNSTSPVYGPQAFSQLSKLDEAERHGSASVDALALFRNAWGVPDEWQKNCLASTSDRLILACSRQSGKSTTASVLAVHTAATQSRSLTLLLSPTLRQSGELLQKCLRVYAATPGLPATTTENRLSIELVNGSRIISLPGKPDTIRGYSAVNLLIVDEAAFCTDNLFVGVRPMLAVSKGRMMIMSTPFGRRGTFYHTWIGENSWDKIKVVASDIPRIDPAFLEEERVALGPLFEQEYFGAFLDSDTSMFSYELVQEALDRGEEIERWF